MVHTSIRPATYGSVSAIRGDTQGAKPAWCGGGEGIATEHVDVLIAERGQPDDIGVIHEVAVLAQCIDGGICVAGVPEHDGVQDQAKCTELVLLALAVALVDLPAPPVEDGACQTVA